MCFSLADAWDLVDHLAVPVRPIGAEQLPILPGLIKYEPHEKQLKPQSKSYSYLVSLADELLLNIIDYLDLRSCFVLSLVSRRMWNFCWPYTETKFLDKLCPWAGTRLICLGDKCYSHDLPAGFLTVAEKEELENGIHEEGYRNGMFRYRVCLVPGPARLVELAEHRFARTRFSNDVCHVSEAFENTIFTYPDRSTLLDDAKLPEPYARQALRFASPCILEGYYPATENWILRNLTVHEFVDGNTLHAAFHRPRKLHNNKKPSASAFSGQRNQRGSRVRGHGQGRRQGTGPDTDLDYNPLQQHEALKTYPGFGEALITRIRWAPDKHRGVWAGHRFEICTEKRHKLLSDDSWKDVTREIVKDLSVQLGLPILRMPAN